MSAAGLNTGLLDPLELLRPIFAALGGVDEVDRVRRGWLLLQSLPRPPVGLTPHSIVHTHDKLQVRFYPPRGDVPQQTPVVIVPSLINRAYICDLEADRSLCGALSAMGHPTYLIDWGIPAIEDGPEDVGYVLEELLHRSVLRIGRHAGVRKMLLLGYCQGGTLSAMYSALHPETVAGLVALNAPVKFSAAGRFRKFVEGLNVDEAFPDDNLVALPLMAAAFKMLDPMGNWSKHEAVEKAASHPRELARVLARERWLEENVPITTAFAREFIRNAYQEDRLLAGSWVIRGRVVDLKRVTCPVLVATCARDFITPIGAATPLMDAVGSSDRTLEVLKTGHIGVIVGSFGPKVFYPMLDRWFRRVAR